MELRGQAVFISMMGSPLECFYKSRVGWTFLSLLYTLSLAQATFASDGMAGFLPIRLVGGSVPSEGRIEVLFNDSWGTVCNDYFDYLDGSVVCRQLNYTGLIRVNESVDPGVGPIWLDDLNCIGTESSIDQCLEGPVGEHDCGHNEDIGVVCDTYNPGEDGAIRLVGGINQSEGRLEIFHDGEWGTVCDFDEDWDINDSNVVCRQLGYTGVSSLESTAVPPNQEEGPGIIWLTRVQCSGLEERLDSCSHGGWGNHMSLCSRRLHSVFVRCEGQLLTPSPTIESSTDLSPTSVQNINDDVSSVYIETTMSGTTDVTQSSTTVMKTSTPSSSIASSSSPTDDNMRPGHMTGKVSTLTIIIVVVMVGILFTALGITTIGGVIFYFRRKSQRRMSFSCHGNEQDSDRDSQESVFTNTSVTTTTSSTSSGSDVQLVTHVHA